MLRPTCLYIQYQHILLHLAARQKCPVCIFPKIVLCPAHSDTHVINMLNGTCAYLLLRNWKNMVPDAVSGISILVIGMVYTKGNVLFLKKRFDFRPVNTKQWTDDIIPHRTYTGKSGKPTAAQKMKQHRLGIVILIVCNCNLSLRRACPLKRLSKNAVTHLSAGFLCGNVTPLRILLHILPDAGQRNLPLLTELLYIRLILVRLSADAMMNMRRLQIERKLSSELF